MARRPVARFSTSSATPSVQDGPLSLVRDKATATRRSQVGSRSASAAERLCSGETRSAAVPLQCRPVSSGLERPRVEFESPRESPRNRALRGKIALFPATGDPGVEPDAAVLETVTRTPYTQHLRGQVTASDRRSDRKPRDLQTVAPATGSCQLAQMGSLLTRLSPVAEPAHEREQNHASSPRASVS